MNEQERLYAIFKDFGVTRENIQEYIDAWLKRGETLEYAISSTKVVLAMALSIPNEFTLEDYAVFAKDVPENVRESYERFKEELLIAAKYNLSGFTVSSLVVEGTRQGFSRKAVLAGLRFGLALECGKQERFSVDEVAEMLGVSLEEAYNLIQQNCNEHCNVTKDVFHQFVQ